MKKYIVLAMCSAAAVFLFSLMPDIIGNARPAVTLTALKIKTYSEKVTASGTVEEKQKNELMLGYPVVVRELKVSVGDKVEAGEVLAVVDKEQTVSAVLETVSSYAESVSAIPDELLTVVAGATLDDSVKQLEMIPDVITANASGTVIGLSLSPGELFLPTQAAVAISDVDALQAKIAVRESDVSKVEVGQTVKITGTGFPDRTCVGTVKQIYPSARKQITGLTAETVVDAIVELKDPVDGIKPGYTVKAVITVQQGEKIAVLPYESVAQDDDGQAYVYVYQNGRAVRRKVKTNREITSGIEITSGVTRQDKVIYDAQAIKKSGTFVRAEKEK